jgi:radical SAM superfamily enzyme YgiQ (UPF0313 family)
MSTPITVPAASMQCQVLLLHAPFPGSLKFEGAPSGLLAAVAPFAHALAERGELDALGLFDPVTASGSYRETFHGLLRSPALRVLCVSTSTAAIEEAAWAVKAAREVAGPRLFIIVGGPHEDDSEEKCAQRLEGVDLSMGGECEFVLSEVLKSFLEDDAAPEDFVRQLEATNAFRSLPGGRVTLSSPWWGSRVRELSLPRLLPEHLSPPVTSGRATRFSVFGEAEVLPVMLSRGCPYGRCSFCSEPNRDGLLVRREFQWLSDLAESHPGAAIYFQDSIFPAGDAIETKLLPLLKGMKRPWGAQVYLPTLSLPFLRRLSDAGCSYLYTGLESGDAGILQAVGKGKLYEQLEERLRWLADLGIQTGISLMFGSLSTDGRLLETEATVRTTVELAERIVRLGVRVAGFYPNVMTVLPGTAVARGLWSRGVAIDFFRMPRSQVLDGFEDGAVGYNFTTISELGGRQTDSLASAVVQAGRVVQEMGAKAW